MYKTYIWLQKQASTCDITWKCSFEVLLTETFSAKDASRKTTIAACWCELHENHSKKSKPFSQYYARHDATTQYKGFYHRFHIPWNLFLCGMRTSHCDGNHGALLARNCRNNDPTGLAVIFGQRRRRGVRMLASSETARLALVQTGPPHTQGGKECRTLCSDPLGEWGQCFLTWTFIRTMLWYALSVTVSALAYIHDISVQRTLGASQGKNDALS